MESNSLSSAEEFSSQHAIEVLSRMALGFHPVNGTPLPADHALRERAVVRALELARVALAEHERRAMRRAQAPRNVGAPWTAEEERLMIAAFDAGNPPSDIAATLERSVTAIEARLEKLGRLAASDRTTRNRFAVRDCRVSVDA
jgi:hypothetical protein